VGEGACLPKLNEQDLSLAEQKQLRRKRRGKCFVYKKKGSCPKGDACLFSHDFEPDTTKENKDKKGSSSNNNNIPNSEKDCLNWKTKGKCKKKDRGTCDFKHCPAVQKRALEKLAKKRNRTSCDNDNDTCSNRKKKRRKEKQPLSVRIFGLSYDTTQRELKDFVEKTAGHPIQSIIFPTFEDSNRSKGYCGVYFASPKAAVAAVEKCDNAELMGRWLRVQTGKSMDLEAWEQLHNKSNKPTTSNNSRVIDQSSSNY